MKPKITNIVYTTVIITLAMFIIVLILIFLLFTKVNVAICGLSLLVTHLLSMVIMVSFAAPADGYVFMTEFMLPLALVISLWAMINRFVGKWKARNQCRTPTAMARNQVVLTN